MKNNKMNPNKSKKTVRYFLIFIKPITIPNNEKIVSKGNLSGINEIPSK